MTHRFSRAMTVLSGAGLAIALAASPATAQRVEGGPCHDEFTDVFTDFCDVPGLTVDYAGVIDGHYSATRAGHGRHRLLRRPPDRSPRPTPTRRPG